MDKKNDKENDIIHLLGSLKHVEAPGDFDVRVRAKIAEGRSSAGRSWFPATAAVAAGLLVIVMAGYLGLRSYSTPAADQPAVEQAAAPIAQPKQEIVQMPPASRNDHIYTRPDGEQTSDAIASKPREIDPRISTPKLPPHQAKAERNEKGGGSMDVASGISETISAIGAQTNRTGRVLIVGEVKQESVAQRSGLKPGDVIVKFVSGKFVRVRRDGKTVEIPLKP